MLQAIGRHLHQRLLSSLNQSTTVVALGFVGLAFALVRVAFFCEQTVHIQPQAHCKNCFVAQNTARSDSDRSEYPALATCGQ